MVRFFHPYILAPSFVGASLLVFSSTAFAQTVEKRIEPIPLPALVKLELTEQFNTSDKFGRISTDRFKLNTAVSDFTFKYSNQAPTLLGGTRFQSLPAGYNLAEFGLKRKWGLLQGFRTTGRNTRLVSPKVARSFAGGAIEIPKAFLGTRLTGFFLTASAAEPLRGSTTRLITQSTGNQLGFVLTKDFKKGIKLESEWNRAGHEPVKNEARERAGSSQGFYFKLSGTLAKSEARITYRYQGENWVNPTSPALGSDKKVLQVDLRRNLKKHLFQFDNQLDCQHDGSTPRSRPLNTRQDNLRWWYSPKLWPKISASHTWKRQSSAGKFEGEENLRVSLNKALKRLTLGLSYLRGTRADQHSGKLLWDRKGLMGNASFEILKNRWLNIHYETEDLWTPAKSQLLSTEKVLIDTRFSLLKDRIDLSPGFSYRHQQDHIRTLDTSLLRFLLSAMLKLPRYLPGTDLLIKFSSEYLTTLHKPDRTSTGFIVQWTLKRL